MKKRLKLLAALGSDKGVQLVDDDVAQSGHQPRHGGATPHEQSLERLGGDEENASRVFDKPMFLAGGDVTMPCHNRYIQRLTQLG